MGIFGGLLLSFLVTKGSFSNRMAGVGENIKVLLFMALAVTLPLLYYVFFAFHWLMTIANSFWFQNFYLFMLAFISIGGTFIVWPRKDSRGLDNPWFQAQGRFYFPIIGIAAACLLISNCYSHFILGSGGWIPFEVGPPPPESLKTLPFGHRHENL